MSPKLTKRDMAVITWTDQGQAWTTRQLALLTGESEANVRRRISTRLVPAKLLTPSPPVEGFGGRRERDYYITAANRRALAKLAPGMDVRATKKRKLSAIPHHRSINDVWMSLEVALRGHTYYSYQFLPHYHFDSSDPRSPTFISAADRRKRTWAERSIIADATVILRCVSGSSLAFLEVCLASENLDDSLRSRSTLLTKLEAYAAFHDADGYKRTGEQMGEGFAGFRVLLVTTSERRVANIRELCERLGSSRFIWLTTLDRITPDKALEPIWATGEDEQMRPLLLGEATFRGIRQ